MLLPHLMLVNLLGSSIAWMNLYLCLICDIFLSIFEPKMYPKDLFLKNSHEIIRMALPF